MITQNNHKALVVAVTKYKSGGDYRKEESVSCGGNHNKT